MTTTIEKSEIVCDPQVGNHWCIQKFTLCLRWREAKRKTQKCKSAFMHSHLPKFDHCFVIRWIYIPVDYVHRSQFVIYRK